MSRVFRQVDVFAEESCTGNPVRPPQRARTIAFRSGPVDAEMLAAAIAILGIEREKVVDAE